MKKPTHTAKRPAKAPRRPIARPAGAVDKARRRAGEPEPVKKSAKLRAVLKRFPAAELAGICGVARQAVYKWRDVPPAHALAIEKASAGVLTKEYLAPDFYPRPTA
jgi:DNA-binding transcriptional regulator YdaS (Cro superfamily)